MINCFDPVISEHDIKSVVECLEGGKLVFGQYVVEFEERFGSLSKKEFNLGLSSASAAAFALFAYFREFHGVCDVYTSSLSFVSPAQAAKMHGHNIIFVDIDRDLLFDVEDYKQKRAKYGKNNTSILMPVLYGGVSNLNTNSVRLWGDEILVVDSAHCLTPTIDYDYGLFSFYPSKPIIMANGGILLKDRRWVSDVAKRRENLGKIKKHFIPRIGRMLSHGANSSVYLGTIILHKDCSNKGFRNFLKNLDVQATYHYPLIHKMKTFNCYNDDLKNTDFYENRIVNIPIHQNLSSADVEKITESINKYDR